MTPIVSLAAGQALARALRVVERETGVQWVAKPVGVPGVLISSADDARVTAGDTDDETTLSIRAMLYLLDIIGVVIGIAVTIAIMAALYLLGLFP